MSLLMDALKKAEMNKRRGEQREAPGNEDLSLEPPTAEPLTPFAPADGGSPFTAPPVAPPRQTTRDATDMSQHLSAHVAATDDALIPLGLSLQGLEPATPTPSGERAATRPEDRRAAENLFTAKQAPQVVAANNRRGAALLIAAGAVLAGLTVAGYFWWQLQGQGGLTLTPGIAASGAPPHGPNAGGALAPVAGTGKTPASAPVDPVARATTTDNAPGSAALATAPARASESPSAASPDAPATRRELPSGQRKAGAGQIEEDDAGVRITRAPLRLNPALASAFEAANRGDDGAAQRAYRAVLDTDSRNADALQGLAALALRAGNSGDAERYFQQLLLGNPKDAVALSGLMNLYARSDPVQAERRLKALAGSQPELAAPLIALGNIYLAQARWADAQQAFFSAYALESDNPDVLYNLAISLEHLEKPVLARQYYRLALEARKTHGASFAASAVEERLRALQP